MFSTIGVPGTKLQPLACPGVSFL